MNPEILGPQGNNNNHHNSKNNPCFPSAQFSKCDFLCTYGWKRWAQKFMRQHRLEMCWSWKMLVSSQPGKRKSTAPVLVTMFLARKKKVASKMLLLKSAPVKKRGRASTQLQNWENVISGALGNLTPCPKHLDVPISSRVCCMAGWSGSTEMCQGYGSPTWGGRRCFQRVCEQYFGKKTKKQLWPGCRGWRLFPWSCWTVVREVNKAGEMRPWSVIFNALHLWEM